MDMHNVNFEGAAGFFGSNQTTKETSAQFGAVADSSVPVGGFSALMEEMTITPEALNSEAAFSVTELLSADESDLLNKIEALEDIDSLLKRVSELLGLNIDMEKSLYKVDPEDIPEEMISQLADFLAGLKEFTQLLKMPAEEGFSIELNGQELQGEEIVHLSESISQEIMNLEIQFTKLDISDKIAVAVANLQNREAKGSGIPVASNPQELAKEQANIPLPETLASLIEKEEGELESIIGNIRLLASSMKETKKTSGETLNDLSKQGEGIKELLVGKKEVVTDGTQGEASENSSDEKTSTQQSPVAVSVANVPAEGEEAAESEDVLSSLLKKSLSGEKKEKAETGAETEKSDVESVALNPLASTETNTAVEISNEDIAEMAAIDIETDQIETLDSVKSSSPTARTNTPRSFEQLVMDQVSGKLSDAVKQGSKEVTIVLKPEFLGEVKVTIQVEGDIVAAKLQVESQQVKQIIENNFQNLRDSLEERNLHAGSLDVNVGQGEDERRAEEQEIPKRRRRINGLPADLDAFEEDPFSEDFLGKETGRRFGSNSVEYFA